MGKKNERKKEVNNIKVKSTRGEERKTRRREKKRATGKKIRE